MKTVWMGMVAASAVVFISTAGVAQASEELARQKNCLACHAVDKKVVGPAYKDVAAKYKGDAGAEAKLIDKVKKGGTGVWGAIPMPPNSPQVKDDDIKTLVKWVLALGGSPATTAAAAAKAAAPAAAAAAAPAAAAAAPAAAAAAAPAAAAAAAPAAAAAAAIADTKAKAEAKVEAKAKAKAEAKAKAKAKAKADAKAKAAAMPHADHKTEEKKIEKKAY